ncbi:acyl-CoA N-acyltransferase [Mollisia scopiformis]|uniref:Acyl-CoA N-acyltransferase n=1 Tax=Mollisia scopiformis TaxID=149040 RepID=A0A194XVE9_MOLSC|nr:acyl-CoA N-acyltransferase [Mollisia scopiformis]KUJ24305.1 acyl-CoA N-acyltransferase [Mollisia scopiformis]
MPESTTPSPLPQNPTFRLARPEDAPAIAHLGSTVFRTTFGYSMPPSDLETYLQTSYSASSITCDLLNPTITVLVATSPISPYPIVGFSQLNRSSSEPCIADSPKPVELQRLYVDTSFHGGGVGKGLVGEVERIAKEEGYRTLWLGVWEENFKAQGFYGRLGFERCGIHSFKMGECVQWDLILKKAI